MPELVLKTHVIDNLDLFKALAGWHAPKVTAQAAAHAPGKTGGLEAAVAAAPGPWRATGPRRPRTRHTQGHVSDGGRSGECEGDRRVAIKPAGTGKTDPPGGLGQKPLSGGSMSGWAEERLAELVKKLRLWNLPVDPEGVEVGPAFARLKVRPAGDKAGYKKVADKAVDLRIHLRLKVEPIIGAQAGYISVDVQLPERRVVPLEAALAQPPEADPTGAGLPRGQDVAGKTHWMNLADPSDCHLLVAGTTGSGKSEFLRAMVASLAARLSYEQVQFVLIDPKRVTFNLQGESPYLRSPIAHDLDKALPLIQECREETQRRYRVLERSAG